MKHNKGLVAVDMMQWFLRIIFLTIVVFSCVFLINMYIRNEVNITDLELDLIAKRFIYSPNGIMYTDEMTGRSYPGVVDLERFNNGKAIMERVINYGEPNYYASSKVSLYINDPNDETLMFIYNEDGYNKWKPWIGINGKGGVDSIIQIVPVFVYDKGKYTRMNLKLEIIIPRS